MGFLIDETGCPTCNKMFSNLIEQQINDSNGIILISALGSTVDLSSYIDDNVWNAYGTKNKFKELNVLSQSGIIFIENEKIDTIIEINSIEIYKQLIYIQDRIDKLN